MSLAFVRRNHRRSVNSPHKWPVKWKMFPFDDVIMGNIIHNVPYFALTYPLQLSVTSNQWIRSSMELSSTKTSKNIYYIILHTSQWIHGIIITASNRIILLCCVSVGLMDPNIGRFLCANAAIQDDCKIGNGQRQFLVLSTRLEF